MTDYPNLPPPLGAAGAHGTYEFHRLWRSTSSYRWWRPLVVLGLFLITSLPLIIFLMIGGLLLVKDAAALLTSQQPIPARPDIFIFIFASVAIVLPAVFIAQLGGRWPKLGYISSVAGRIRWRWLLISTGIAFGIFAIITPLSILLDAPSVWPTIDITPKWLILTVLLFLIIPFQIATEEYVFRGFLMQAIGSWLKNPIWAILIQVPAFTFSHAYGGWAMADISLFALGMGYLTWRTGGIESAMGFHLINNWASSILVIFVVGSYDSTATGTFIGFLISLVMMAAYIGLIELVWRRQSLTRTVKVDENGRLTPPPAVD